MQSQDIIRKIKDTTPIGSGKVQILGVEISAEQLLDLHNYAKKELTPKTVLIIKPEELRSRLQNGYDVNTRIHNGYTLAHWYCIKKDASRLKIVLEFNPDLTLKDHEGQTAQDYLLSSKENQAKECFDLLINYGYTVFKISQTPITKHQILDISPQELRHRLQNGLDVDFRVFEGMTLAHYYCYYVCPEKLSVVLEFYPDLSLKDIRGKVPLNYLLEKNEPGVLECLKLLAEYGKINDAEKVLRLYSHNPEHYRLECYNRIPEFSATQLDKFLQVITKDSNFRLNNPIGNMDLPLLHYYSKEGKPEHLRVVLKYGPNLAAKDWNDRIAISYVLARCPSQSIETVDSMVKKLPSEYAECLNIFLQYIKDK